jgi:murein tripeptide amidase MpaA
MRSPQTGAVQPIAPRDWSVGYHTFTEMTAMLRGLAEAAGQAVSLQSIATTHAGREVWLLRVAAVGDVPPDQRQALLITGGIDADHPAGSETALNVTRRLVAALSEEPDGDLAEMLRQRTVYVVPRLNPDGIEAFFKPLRHAARVNTRPIDNDRDGLVDEDGPNDLDGDGLITVMRARDPQGEWIVDPDEPRLLKKAERTKGERGIYKLVVEGIDDDGDGEINEDGPGGVDDDRNWPHLFEAGVKAAGIHQLCEPEDRALAQFVVDRPNITVAITYGRHDNIVTVPKGQERGPAKRAYRDLHPDDVKLYEHTSEKYKRATGLSESPGCRADGAFYSWIYAQRGVLSFATNLWWPLKPEQREKPSTQATTRPTTQPRLGRRGRRTRPVPDEGTAETAVEQSDTRQELDRETIMPPFREQSGGRQPTPEEARAFFERMRGGRTAVRTEPGAGPPEASRGERRIGRQRGERRFGRPAPEAGPAKPAAEPLAQHVESTDVNQRWLEYNDERRGGEGFVQWTPFDHPTLGKVEIGGFAPYSKTTPPADQLDEIADKQIAFLVELAQLLAAPRFGDAKVDDLGGGIWQVEATLVNDGYLPTHPAIARHIHMPGFVIRPLVENERLIGGRPQERADNLLGSGGTASWKWLIRGEAGETLEFRAFNRVYGELKATVVLRETEPDSEAK